MSEIKRQFKRLLLAVDGSQHALSAADWLCHMANPSDCEVRVIAVLIPRQAQMHANLESALQEVSDILVKFHIAPKTELLTGYPAQTLVAYADEYKPDLIFLGAHGLRATLGILLGGVAQQVVEYARWPVFVARTPYKELSQVLLLNDGSIYSERAVEFLSRMPLPKKTMILACHVLPPVPTPEMIARSWPLDLQTGNQFVVEQLEKSLERQAEFEEKDGRRILDDTQAVLATAGHQTKAVLLRGDAASEVIEFVRQNKVDLIVAGSRGLGQVRGWLLGSVSRKLLHYADCSVLIVRDTDNGA